MSSWLSNPCFCKVFWFSNSCICRLICSSVFVLCSWAAWICPSSRTTIPSSSATRGSARFSEDATGVFLCSSIRRFRDWICSSFSFTAFESPLFCSTRSVSSFLISASLASRMRDKSVFFCPSVALSSTCALRFLIWSWRSFMRLSFWTICWLSFLKNSLLRLTSALSSPGFIFSPRFGHSLLVSPFRSFGTGNPWSLWKACQ